MYDETNKLKIHPSCPTLCVCVCVCVCVCACVFFPTLWYIKRVCRQLPTTLVPYTAAISSRLSSLAHSLFSFSLLHTHTQLQCTYKPTHLHFTMLIVHFLEDSYGHFTLPGFLCSCTSSVLWYALIYTHTHLLFPHRSSSHTHTHAHTHTHTDKHTNTHPHLHQQ